MPARARGRVGPPDRKVVRQVAIIHRYIRTNARRKVDRKTYQATIDIVILTADSPADDEP
jgi:hypothetical protein